jgi:phenylacetate-CoA ligase
MPFIRYKIGDVGRLLDRDCPCGRQWPLLKLTQGRITDIIITADGRPLPGEFFPHLFKEVAEHVEQFQIIQDRLDHLIVSIVPASSYGPQQTDYLRKRIREKVGATVDIEFRLTDAIAPEASGKLRVTVSRMKENGH